MKVVNRMSKQSTRNLSASTVWDFSWQQKVETIMSEQTIQVSSASIAKKRFWLEKHSKNTFTKFIKTTSAVTVMNLSQLKMIELQLKKVRAEQIDIDLGAGPAKGQAGGEFDRNELLKYIVSTKKSENSDK